MSANLDTGGASAPTDAAVVGNPSVDSPGASAPGQSAERSSNTAASDLDATVRNLSSKYRENLLDQSSIEDGNDPEPTPKESTPEPDEAPEPIAAKDNAAAPADDIDDDILAEERTGPRTLEDFNKQYPRTPVAVREELAKVEAQKWELQTKVNELGGNVGIGLAKELIPAILNVNPDAASANSVFETLTITNPALVQEMSVQLLNAALNEEAIDPGSGLPIGVQTWNALIKEHLDPDFDVDRIQKLVEWDKAGLIDHDAMAEQAELYTGPSEREKELEQRLKALEGERQQDKATRENEQRQLSRQGYDKAINHLSTKVMESALPIAEHFGWTVTKDELNSTDPNVKALADSKIAMGKMLTDHINAELRRSPEWATVDHLARNGQAFNADGNPTALYAKNSEALANKILANFKGLVRTLNPTFAKGFGSNRAAELKQKIRSGNGNTQPVPPVRASTPATNGASVEDRVAEQTRLYREARKGWQ